MNDEETKRIEEENRQKAEEEAKRKAEANSAGTKNQGNSETPKSMIEDANKAAERLETANAKQEELIKRQEDIEVRRKLGGNASAGQNNEQPEETDKAYAERVMNGEVGK